MGNSQTKGTLYIVREKIYPQWHVQRQGGVEQLKQCRLQRFVNRNTTDHFALTVHYSTTTKAQTKRQTRNSWWTHFSLERYRYTFTLASLPEIELLQNETVFIVTVQYKSFTREIKHAENVHLSDKLTMCYTILRQYRAPAVRTKFAKDYIISTKLRHESTHVFEQLRPLAQKRGTAKAGASAGSTWERCSTMFKKKIGSAIPNATFPTAAKEVYGQTRNQGKLR